MRSDRRSIVPTALGLVLLASAAVDCHDLVASARNYDWSLFARAELELYGGLWLLSRLASRWAGISAIIAFVGILTRDMARAITGYPPRDALGQLGVGPWWVLASDLLILFAVLRWRPAMASAPLIASHPGRLAGAAVIAAVLGIAIDRSQVGYFPIVATAGTEGSPTSPGLDYLIYLPGGYYCSCKRWPLILYLHGAGRVGRDIAQARTGLLPRYLEAGGRLPFIIVAPQSPQRGWDVGALITILDEVLRRYRVDANRAYLTGEIMGGYGTWAMAAAHPERFAAIAPICGGGNPASADRLRGVPTWAFHGAEDVVVPLEESRKMVAAVERAGGDVRLTIYPRVGHNSAARTYADRSLYDWFLAQRRVACKSDEAGMVTHSDGSR